MLPPATLAVAQRLIASLMSLLRAAADVATGGGIPTLAPDDAHTLFYRLSTLVLRLIGITTAGLRPPPKPRAPAAEPAAAREPAAPSPGSTSGAAPSLPRRPGWLLAALPGTAPTIADEIRALLDDPALAPLLADATLHRALAALLRSLGLPEPAAPPSPGAPPQAPAPTRGPSPATPATSTPAGPILRREIDLPGPAFSRGQIIPIS